MGGGCLLWLCADLGITLNGGSVSSWGDQSGSGHGVTQGTPAQQPTYNAIDASYNGRPTLSFASASSQNMLSPTVTASQPMTMIAVGNAGAGGAQQDFCAGSSTIQLFSSSNNLNLFAGSTLTSTASVLSPCVMAGVFNGASSLLYVNSSGTPVAGPGAAGAGGGSQVSIGFSGSGAFLNGKIAEVIWYPFALSTSQLYRAFQYLGAKWGVATS